MENGTPSFLSSTGARIIGGEELAGPQGAVVPPAPPFQRYGETVAYMTPRFVLSASNEVYRIFRFQSVQPRTEFPRTPGGWTRAWNAFRALDAEAVGATP